MTKGHNILKVIEAGISAVAAAAAFATATAAAHS